MTSYLKTAKSLQMNSKELVKTRLHVQKRSVKNLKRTGLGGLGRVRFSDLSLGRPNEL